MTPDKAKSIDKPCWKCEGVEPSYFSHTCEKHNVCIQCNTPRSELKEIPWGVKGGFLCIPCDTRNKKARIDNFQAEAHEEWDFENNDAMVCPYCGYENEASDGSDCVEDGHEFDRECAECGSIMHVECSVTITWSTPKTKTA